MTQNLPTIQSQNALEPKNFSELEQFANIVSNSSFVPKDFKGRIPDIMIAVQMGAEIGLKPIQALHNIAVINGRPSLWGDVVIALVRSSGLCEYIHESYDEKTATATCTGKRKGDPEEQSQSFSWDDAQKAGLINNPKKNIWRQYPKRMLQMRARGFLLRDLWADVLRGLITREEAEDYPSQPEQVQEVKPQFKKIDSDDRPLLEEITQPIMMTQKQSQLIGKLINSHVFTEQEKSKTKLFLSTSQDRETGKKMIDRLLSLIETRKAEEKKAEADVPFGSVRKDERSEEEIKQAQENTLADLIAGLDSCGRAVDVSDYIEQVTGALLILPEEMQEEFNIAQGEHIKNL